MTSLLQGEPRICSAQLSLRVGLHWLRLLFLAALGDLSARAGRSSLKLPRIWGQLGSGKHLMESHRSNPMSSGTARALFESDENSLFSS